jgi:hypothetical protein
MMRDGGREVRGGAADSMRECRLNRVEGYERPTSGVLSVVVVDDQSQDTALDSRYRFPKVQVVACGYAVLHARASFDRIASLCRLAITRRVYSRS